MRENREKRRAVFASRYVSRQDAMQFNGSTFQRLFAMDDVAEEEIDEANKKMYDKIANVAPRTDDLIDDEEAGEARSRMAARSRARKAEQAARIAEENEELGRRLRNTRAQTDNMLDEEACAIRRAEMAAEAEARRESDAIEQAIRNQRCRNGSRQSLPLSMITSSTRSWRRTCASGGFKDAKGGRGSAHRKSNIFLRSSVSNAKTTRTPI